MTEVLSKGTEEDTTVATLDEEEDDEETRDFYIYILSREHPTVLTPVANPYKRSDRIKEANAELLAESPTPNTTRSGAKIRFNDTPMLYEYIKQEDVLSLLNGDSSPHELDSSPVNNSTSDNSSQQNTTKRRQMTDEFDAANQDKENQSINKENIHPLESKENKNEKLCQDNHEKIKNTVSKGSNEIIEDSVLLTTLDDENNQTLSATKCLTKIQDSTDFKESLILDDVHDDEKTDQGSSRYSRYDEFYPEDLMVSKKNNINKNDVNTDKLTSNQDIKSIHNTNEKELKTIPEKHLVTEEKFPKNSVEIKPIVNNNEKKLNYRPISAERSNVSFNKTSKITTPSSGSKLKTGVGDNKEEKTKVDATKNNKTIGTTKKNMSINKSKAVISKQETVTETPKKSKPPIVKANKNDNVKAISKESIKDFESTRVKLAQSNSIEVKDLDCLTKEKSQSPEAPLENSKVVASSEMKSSNESPNLLSSEEVKSKLEEIKEQNRSKLVVLVPPFEQYKSYMNDNYSDSDDNESFDIEEFLRKEDQGNDLTPYVPDFELESDNELDELCKENPSLAAFSTMYPESICTKRRGLQGKKATGSKRMTDKRTSSVEDDELRRHQSKMMDNVKSSQQYENSMKKFSQQNGASSGTKCKQKCLQRPSTAPEGRKFGCDCKWPRIKLPEYNGLRSEYGLSAEQLCERKRQRQEITKRMRERRQRKVDEEERRKMENERMFHEWLLKKRAQAKEQWLRNQRLRAMRYSRQCITPNQSKLKSAQPNANTPLAVRKKLHPGRNCFSLDEIINDVTERNDDNKTYKIYLGLSIE